MFSGCDGRRRGVNIFLHPPPFLLLHSKSDHHLDHHGCGRHPGQGRQKQHVGGSRGRDTRRRATRRLTGGALVGGGGGGRGGGSQEMNIYIKRENKF